MKYIYLHGFNSSGQSNKGRYFSEHLDAKVDCPTYTHVPNRAITYLHGYLADQLQTDKQIILIGSSLGGYYSQFLSHQFDLPTVLINPALQPHITLRAYIGKQQNYYSGQLYDFTDEHLQQFRLYDVPDPCQRILPSLLLLDAADELIDYRIAKQRYAACANIIIYPGGSHEFDHLAEAVAAIREFTSLICERDSKI